MRRVHAVLVHRHGDRTPITRIAGRPLWRSLLPDSARLARLHQRHPATAGSRHRAAGEPPFGQLTALGLDQLGQLGRRLRAQGGPPASVSCHATPFERTIQSTQALLAGLEAPPGVEVDTSLGELLLPDPEPRHPRQAELEAAVRHADSPELDRLAERCVDRLAAGGVLEARARLYRPEGEVNWNRLAEVSKCVEVHWERPLIDPADREAVMWHAASRWFEMFQTRELTKYAIGGMLQRMLRVLQSPDRPELQIYSAHDSTLIALLSALQVESLDGVPMMEWPPYASYLMIELLAEPSGELRLACSYNGQQVLLGGAACRAVPRDGAGYPLEAVLADAEDVLAPESRDEATIDRELARV